MVMQLQCGHMGLTDLDHLLMFLIFVKKISLFYHILCLYRKYMYNWGIIGE